MKSTFRALLLSLTLFVGVAWANPSAFPETAATFRLGYDGALAFAAGGELLVPTRYLDTSVQGHLLLDTAGRFGWRLAGTALVFPALAWAGPPLALGVGADLGAQAGRGFGVHAGLVVGSDLLFTVRQPLTVSAYLAPGYAVDTGFSLAWELELRYYLENVALELFSSDLMLVGVGVRYLF